MNGLEDTLFKVAGGTLIGFLLSQIFLSKKERADVGQKNYENSIAATSSHDKAYKDYTDALSAYIQSDDPNFDEFLKLSTSGDIYFSEVGKLCYTILANRADAGIRDSAWLPKIKVAFERLLPAHYDMLIAQAKKKNYQYTGKLRRQDDEPIFAVAEQFSSSSAWLRPHEDD